ncbi:unnamed protein product, partial [Amoebophrya sp. A25]|eukprot:GSA25T00025927001.1
MGRLCRGFSQLKYAPRGFFTSTLMGEHKWDLRRRLHELKHWNVIDIGESVAKLFYKEDHEKDDYDQLASTSGGSGCSYTEEKANFLSSHDDLAERIGTEVYQHNLTMRGSYHARALRLLDWLKVGNQRTVQALVRYIPRRVHTLGPKLTVDTLIAASNLGMRPMTVYHRITGERFFRMLAFHIGKHLDSGKLGR